MTTTTIGITVIVFVTLIIIGVLIGISMHREATHYRRRSLLRRELDLDRRTMLEEMRRGRG